MSQALANPLKKLYIHTFGCQMNEYDSSRMSDLLAATHALETVKTPEDADVLLLNTCSVREKAQEKVFSELGRWRKLKEKKPHMLIGVGGCVASQEGEDIQKRAPYVDLVFGPQTIHRLPNLINQVTKTRSPQVDISFPEIEKFDRLPDPKVEGCSAFISIMEGCSKYCSFCIVPYTRGEEFSRPFDDVLVESVTLAEQGVREIILLGQNVNAYRGKMHNGSIADLALLIYHLAEIEGIKRIRYTTSHPKEFSDSLIQAYADVPELANHLHLPVQSGSNRILNLMKRGHTIDMYIDKMEKLKSVRPDICISTDLIVGFPGERDEDFMETMDLVHTIGFDFSFSFIYSARPGTPAANMKDTVTLNEKKQRLNILQQRLTLQGKAISEKMIDSYQKIIVTGKSKKHHNEFSGRTENNRVVNFPLSEEYSSIKDEQLNGQVVTVKILEAKPNSLRGELVQLET